MCRYFSPIFKNGSSTYARNESALQALYYNRKSQTKLVLCSLKCILEAILDDKWRRILRFLKRMDPPTYQYARYWDWIKPWVEHEVESNTKNRHIPVFGAELELSVNVLSLIEQVEVVERGDAEDGSQPRQDGDVIQYPQEDQGPKPYIMWEMQNADIMERKDD